MHTYCGVIVTFTLSYITPMLWYAHFIFYSEGLVLGSILLLVFINDLLECIKYGTIRLFADDCISYVSTSKIHQ